MNFLNLGIMKTRKSKFRVFRFTKYLLLIFLLLASCVSQKKLDYIQPDFVYGEYKNHTLEETLVKPGDELYIRVTSLDDVAYNFFTNQAAVNQQNLTNELSVSLVTFTVSDSGYIRYPITGDLYVQDMNVAQVATDLQDILSSYFNQPTVTIKKVNRMITVIGEVRMPGKYTYTQQTLNIFEGLAMAGDITIHGNKNEVILLRDEDGTIKRWLCDMTSDSLIITPQYYLKSGDVLIVKSRKTALWSITASSVSLILAFMTTLIVVLTYLQP